MKRDDGYHREFFHDMGERLGDWIGRHFERPETTSATFDDYRLFIGGREQDVRSGADSFMDVAFGRAGDDVLRGGGRDDDLLGGKGDDRLNGQDGMDHLDGGKGADTLHGGAEADNLVGGDGKDRLDEGPGHGNIEGGQGDDILRGGLGADAFVVDPDSGHDVIRDFRAGPGMFDHLAFRDVEPEELEFADTPDGVRISWNDGGSSVLLAGVSKHELAQDDFMFTEHKELIPVGGADGTPHAAAEIADLLWAQPSFEDAAATIFGREDVFRFDEFLVKFGGPGRDAFRGGAERDFFFGLDGDDRLVGGDGDDDLRGDGGADLLRGGDGMDHLTGGAGRDRLYGGDEADHLMGDDGRDAISAGAGHDMVEGGRGNDTLDGGDGADAFIVDPRSGHDVIVGGFTPGPGAFDHIAFVEILPEQVTVEDLGSDVRIAWGSGSIRIKGVQKHDLAQDDFMFNDVEGGGFVDDPAITLEGSRLLFPADSDGVWT